MGTDNDLIKLYSGQILALAADIPHLGRLDAPDASVKKRSPLCGSAVTVDVKIVDGRIAAFGQDVKACALGQAAAAVVGHAIIGRTQDEVEAGRDALRAMLNESCPTPADPWNRLKVLEPARAFHTRHYPTLLSL